MSLAIPSAAAETIFTIGFLPITNTMINAWIAVVFFVVVALVIRLTLKERPCSFQNAIEAVVAGMLSEIEKVTSNKKDARTFLPIVGTIFLFILFSNWIGLLPGTGSIGVYGLHNGEIELLPLLRPAASDLNLTLAIALFAVFLSHFFGIRATGVLNHVSKFVNIRGVVLSFKKGPMAILISFIEFGVGLLEIISEFAKVLSLSLRLFGNIFAGEVLLTVMLGLFSVFLPIPFLFLELLVGIIQATVFSMLTLSYLVVLSQDHSQQEAH